MKDQYVGDINDYAKYALCRALIADGDQRVGVWWMRTPNDGRSDGALTSYLGRGDWSRLDPKLFAVMRSLVEGDRRSLGHVEETRVLPGATFWSAPVPLVPRERRADFARMLGRFRDRDLVLFDPDMGMEVVSVPPGHARSNQYVYRGELDETYAAGHSLIVFQYFPRMQRRRFVAQRLGQLDAWVRPAVACCVWTPRVAFFLAIHESRLPVLMPRLEGFARRWRLPLVARGGSAGWGCEGPSARHAVALGCAPATPGRRPPVGARGGATTES